MFAWAGAELGLGLQASAYPMPPRLIIVYATLLQGLPTRIFFASLIHEWACDAILLLFAFHFVRPNIAT